MSNGGVDAPVYDNVINEDNNAGFPNDNASKDSKDEEYYNKELLEGSEDQEDYQTMSSNTKSNKRRRLNKMTD